MRLTDYENEEALELLADIMEPAAVIMSDKEIATMVQSGVPAIVIAPKILRGHPKEVIEIIASMHREKPDTYKFNAVSLLHDLVDIMNDPELVDLFTSQGQKLQDMNSGSAMENGEAEA